MGVHFADYEPELHGNSAVVDVRLLSRDLVDACAALAADREAGDPRHERGQSPFVSSEPDVDRWRASLERNLAASDRVTFVGLVGGEVAGYANAARLSPASDSESSTAPEGWYLLGVVIAPRHRRRGVGRALTAARLRWLCERADRAWYFVSSENRASIDLHSPFGFVQVATDLAFPDVSFTGTGLLYRAELTDTGLGG